MFTLRDSEISQLLGVPEPMLQRWKRSNDYRFTVYQVLRRLPVSQIEQLLSNISEKEGVRYIGSKEFSESMDRLYNLPAYEMYPRLLGGDIEKVNEISLNIGPRRNRVFEGMDGCLKVKMVQRFPDKRDLVRYLNELLGAFEQEKMRLDQVLYITNEGKLPRYMRDSNDPQLVELLQKVRVEMIPFNELAQELFGSRVILNLESQWR